MTPLAVLITNLKLTARSGTEIYVRDLALELRRRGHSVAVYAPIAGGGIADELCSASIPVVSRLDDVGFRPDVIHGHHTHQTLAALLHFADAPAVFLCHDARAWHDEPPRHPRVRRYVAVDHTCREWRLGESDVPAARVRVILNFVDLRRFAPRGRLPGRPARALVFSHLARPGNFYDAIAEACLRQRIALDTAGASAGRTAERPEALLAEYDLVFAKGKAAMEALAVGAAVILVDEMGLGRLVTSSDFAAQRRANFGRRLLERPVTAKLLSAEIARYDAKDAMRVSRRMRDCGGLVEAVDSLVALYQEVVSEHAGEGAPDPEAERAAVAACMARIAATETLIDAENYRRQNETLQQEHTVLRQRIARLTSLP